MWTASQGIVIISISPDNLINDVKREERSIDPVRLQTHVKTLDGFVATLQDGGLAP